MKGGIALALKLVPLIQWQTSYIKFCKSKETKYQFSWKYIRKGRIDSCGMMVN